MVQTFKYGPGNLLKGTHILRPENDERIGAAINENRQLTVQELEEDLESKT